MVSIEYRELVQLDAVVARKKLFAMVGRFSCVGAVVPAAKVVRMWVNNTLQKRQLVI